MAQRASQFALGRDKKTHTKQERLNKRAVQHVLVVTPKRRTHRTHRQRPGAGRHRSVKIVAIALAPGDLPVERGR